LGSSAYEISRIIKSTQSIIVSNPDWEKGIGTSIKAGLDYAVQNSPGVDAVIFLVCDQYRLKSETIDKIIQKSREHPDKIIASSYAGTIGIPALFVEKHFDEIMNIPDNKGCKEIMHAHINEVIAVDFPGGDSDIDEEGDIPNSKSF
jgi:molybdenum cofactor cytidylyltransferase